MTGKDGIYRRSAQTLWRARWRLAAWAGVGVFLWAVARFYDEGTGFTELIAIGDKISEPVTTMDTLPHYVYRNSYGYDGAYYVQLALHPLLGSAELPHTIDNLPYRAKRILLCWVAWLAGLGQPWWVVQAFALLNVASWLALAWLLQRWFPPVSWDNLLRWAGVLFSHGVCVSVHNSLVDAPSLLLVALAVASLERGRRPGGVAWLAAATLCKETSLIASVALVQPPVRGWLRWRRLAGAALLAALPLAAWLVYIRVRVGSGNDSGWGNFTWPLAGIAEKWTTVLADWQTPDRTRLKLITLCTTAALTVQFLFLALRWRPAEIWWRVGAGFAVLLVFVGQPVWEGYPGAASRVLLPMALAFNILVPRGGRWLPVLLAGNLAVVAGVFEFDSVPNEFFRTRGERTTLAALRVTPGEDWYPVEADSGHRWRWSQGHGSLRLVNRSAASIEVRLAGTVVPAASRRLVLKVRGEPVWAHGPTAGSIKLDAVTFLLPPGESMLEFDSDGPAVKGFNGDTRPLALAVFNLVISVAPAPPSRQP